MTAVIYSCKKDKEKEPEDPSITYPNFSKLKTGNYWIYEQYDIDASGNATSLNTFDSCYVEKDTVINNQTYMKVVRPDPISQNQVQISFQKDSLHYIVNHYGQILFSSQDFSTIFESYYLMAGPNDTLCHYTRKMADKDLPVTTPAGTFITSGVKNTYRFYNMVAGGNPRNMSTRYAVNIGIVTEALSFTPADPGYTERRLVRYHIN